MVTSFESRPDMHAAYPMSGSIAAECDKYVTTSHGNEHCITHR